MISRRTQSAVEGLREALAAAGAIFVHSTIVHYFELGALSPLSFLGAVMVFFLLWWFFTYRLDIWIDNSERHDRLDGCWGGTVTVGSDIRPSRVSIFNVYRINGETKVEGTSLSFAAGDAGTKFEKHGSWNSSRIAYSNGTLMYVYDSAKYGIGLCVYNFQRGGAVHVPVGYTGNFYDKGSDITYTAEGKKLGEFVVDLNDLKSLSEYAEDILLRLHPGLIKLSPEKHFSRIDL